MKDKQAERRKQKRRLERMKEERQWSAELYESYEAERKRLGRPKVPIKPEKLMRMYNKTVKDAVVQAIMYGVIAAMSHLHDRYRWNRVRLLRFTNYCHNIIAAIGTDERPIKRLIEDLQYDGIDPWVYVSRVEGNPVPMIKRERATELRLIHEKIIGGVVVPLYTLRHYYRFGAKRMSRAAKAIQWDLTEMLTYDRAEEYINRIYNATGVKLVLDGRIMIDE